MRRLFYRSHMRHVSTHDPSTDDFREDVDELLECMSSKECPCDMEGACVEFAKEKLTDGTVFILEED